VISNPPETGALAKARQVDNYPGLTGMSGTEVLEQMTAGLAKQEIPMVTGRVTAAMAMKTGFMVSVGQQVYTARALILATGAALAKPYPGEAELLGRGVSYCATCDGMLYRGRAVAVLGLGAEGRTDADFLESIGCQVTYFDKTSARQYEIRGESQVTALVADGREYPVDGVFILRDTVAASVLLPGIAMEAGHIAVDEHMAGSIPGLFAAGDCTGRPYQIARAVGQGNIAALSADAYIKEKEQKT
jgi:thioredoxin reductase (NADPH)